MINPISRLLQLGTKAKIILAIVVLLSAVAAIMLHRPIGQAIKDWRAEKLIEEARSFAEAGDWNEVGRTASASMQNKESLEAARLFTEAAFHTNDPRVPKLAVALFQYPGATTKDRALSLELILDAYDLMSASRLVTQLPPEEYHDPAMHYQLVRALLMAGSFRKAIALADDPTMTSRDPALDLLLAKGFAKNNSTEARDATTARLRPLLTSNDQDFALQAMRLLASLPDDRIEESLATAAIERFQDDSTLGVVDRLHLDFFRIGLKKESQEELVEKAIVQYYKTDLNHLVTWLARLGQSKRIVELTNPVATHAGLDINIFQHRSRALEALGQREQLSAELKDPPVDVPKPLLLSARAVLATRMGEDTNAWRLWSEAFEVARRDRSRNWYYQLAATAEKAGNTDRQMQALAAGIEHLRGTPPPARTLSPLFQWLEDQGDTQSLLNVSYHLLRREPGNPLLINNYLYLKALHDTPSRKDLPTLHKLVEAFPDQPAFRNTLAFTLFRLDDPQGALEELDHINSDPTELSDSNQALYKKARQALVKKIPRVRASNSAK